MANKHIFFSGSFDPPTNGHLDVISKALAIADHVVIGIGVHPAKKPLFSFEERQVLIEEAVTALHGAEANRINIVAFADLVVDAARFNNATLIIRGLRDATDFDYEMQMAGMNGTMAPDVETLFVPAAPDTRHITSTLVRQIAAMCGDLSNFVPQNVAAALSQKFGTERG